MGHYGINKTSWLPTAETRPTFSTGGNAVYLQGKTLATYQTQLMCMRVVTPYRRW